VVPESDTAMLYCVRSESIARYNESGHASHAHLISMYSPSDADFLSVESVIFFFIGWNSCSWYIRAILLPNKESPAHCQAYIAQINTNVAPVPPNR
jgi:hypothetical protein